MIEGRKEEIYTEGNKCIILNLSIFSDHFLRISLGQEKPSARDQRFLSHYFDSQNPLKIFSKCLLDKKNQVHGDKVFSRTILTLKIL